ncbi:MAG TPA: chromate transporter, partial [Bacteroidota bacterium]
SFVFVLLIGPFVPRLRNSLLMQGFLDGVNAGALGLMLGVCFILGQSTLLSIGTGAIFVIALFVQIRWRVNAAWVVAGGALAGWVAGLL